MLLDSKNCYFTLELYTAAQSEGFPNIWLLLHTQQNPQHCLIPQPLDPYSLCSVFLVVLIFGLGLHLSSIMTSSPTWREIPIPQPVTESFCLLSPSSLPSLKKTTQDTTEGDVVCYWLTSRNPLMIDYEEEERKEAYDLISSPYDRSGQRGRGCNEANWHLFCGEVFICYPLPLPL